MSKKIISLFAIFISLIVVCLILLFTIKIQNTVFCTLWKINETNYIQINVNDVTQIDDSKIKFEYNKNYYELTYDEKYYNDKYCYLSLSDYLETDESVVTVKVFLSSNTLLHF